MIDFGHGVTLGPIEKKWLESMRRWRNSPSIYKWCRQNDLISEIDQANWYERSENDPTIKMYLIWHSQDIPEHSAPLGVCGLTSIDMHSRRAEFSLYIAPDQHGEGHGKRALSTLIDHGFVNLGLENIWGESFEGNPAMKMFEKLGFKKEGTRRSFYFKDGKFIDAHLFSILRREWK